MHTSVALMSSFSGRVFSTEFMELPNKKQWPIYYKTIKRPQCLENIFVSRALATMRLV